MNTYSSVVGFLSTGGVAIRVAQYIHVSMHHVLSYVPLPRTAYESTMSDRSGLISVAFQISTGHAPKPGAEKM